MSKNIVIPKTVVNKNLGYINVWIPFYYFQVYIIKQKPLLSGIQNYFNE